MELEPLSIKATYQDDQEPWSYNFRLVFEGPALTGEVTDAQAIDLMERIGAADIFAARGAEYDPPHTYTLVAVDVYGLTRNVPLD